MSTTDKKPRRREFIPEIRQGISKNVPAADEAVQEAIDNWRDGNEPAHPLEAGVFAMCDAIAADLDKMDDDAGGSS